MNRLYVLKLLYPYSQRSYYCNLGMLCSVWYFPLAENLKRENETGYILDKTRLSKVSEYQEVRYYSFMNSNIHKIIASGATTNIVST